MMDFLRRELDLMAGRKAVVWPSFVNNRYSYAWFPKFSPVTISTRSPKLQVILAVGYGRFAARRYFPALPVRHRFA
jgi:hypothetical protein